MPSTAFDSAPEHRIRTFFNKITRTFFIAVFFAISATGAGAEERVLHILTWADYFDSEVLASFQKKYDCSISIDTFDSNEILFKALQLDRSGYDVLTPSSYMTSTLHRNGYLTKINHSLLPNLRHLTADATALTADPEMLFSIPYTLTVTGIGYNRKLISTDELGSWNALDTLPNPGSVAFLTDMREGLGAALKSLGYSLNTTDDEEISAAGRVLSRWKRRIDIFDTEAGKEGLINGTYALIMNYNGDILQAMAENPDLDFFIPGEGASATSDEFAIAADSPAKDLAHAFINHMLDPEIARKNMETVRYYMPNAEALKQLSPELRDSPAFFLDPEVFAKCEVIQDVGEANRIYEKVWEEVTR